MWRRTYWGGLGVALALGCGPPLASPEPGPSVLTLLHTSDIHSRLWPFRARITSFEAEHGLGTAGELAEVGGFARLSTLLERERRQGAALWLDSGDALEGAPVFHRYGGRVELELLAALGLSAMALGNHELALSAPSLADLLRAAAPFPVLAANLRPAPGSALEGWVLPSVLLDARGLRLGVIGVANLRSPPGLGRADNDWALDAVIDVAAAVQLALDDLAPRASLVVVLSHLGLQGDRALVRGTTGLGAVLGGHQHLLRPQPEWEDDCASSALSAARGCSPRGVPIVHSGAYGQWLTRLELQLAPDPSRPAQLEVTAALLRPLPVVESVPEHPDVVAYLTEHAPPSQPPLGFLPLALPRRSPLGGDSALGDLTTDAVLKSSGADVVVLNSSGLREDLEAGVLIGSDLELAFPFAEQWRLARMDGGALRRGLLRAAQRSARQDCESSVQVAGLRLSVHCSACGGDAGGCLRVEREAPFRRALLDEEQLLVAVPEYLTLPGADFELDEAATTALEFSVPDALGRLLSALPAAADPEPCVSALTGWSRRRCSEAFGERACPLELQRARELCRRLPLVEDTRDGRIEMQP